MRRLSKLTTIRIVLILIFCIIGGLYLLTEYSGWSGEPALIARYVWIGVLTIFVLSSIVLAIMQAKKIP
jgi:hypothetical protein